MTQMRLYEMSYRENEKKEKINKSENQGMGKWKMWKRRNKGKNYMIRIYENEKIRKKNWNEKWEKYIICEKTEKEIKRNCENLWINGENEKLEIRNAKWGVMSNKKNW